MNSKARIPAIALSIALVLSVMGPGIAMATDETSDLSVHVEQDDTIEVTVAENGTGVGNATVNVTADGNATYDGAGEYETDANGTVELPVPEETVDVTVTAEYDGETANTTATLEPALSVWVRQAADGSATVNVFEGDAPVANATVNVTADGDATYDGAGEYETAEDGTVALPAPGETVDVTVTATVDDRVEAAEKTLQADPALSVSIRQNDDGSATVDVTKADESIGNATVEVTTDDENATYAGTGEYETDGDGTVGLPAPAETVDVTVSVEYDNETASTSATLEGAEGPELSFGQEVSAFVHGLLNGADGNTTIGEQVSEFVTSNNPGNASEHAGPKNDTGRPAHAGPGGDADESERAGGNGKPAHAGPGNETAAAGQSDSPDDGDAGGPPEDRGNGNGDRDEGDRGDGNAGSGDRGDGNAGNGNGGGPP